MQEIRNSMDTCLIMDQKRFQKQMLQKNLKQKKCPKLKSLKNHYHRLKPNLHPGKKPKPVPNRYPEQKAVLRTPRRFQIQKWQISTIQP